MTASVRTLLPAWLAGAALVLAGCAVFRQAAPPDDTLADWSAVPLAPDARLATKALAFESCHGGSDAGGIQIILQDRRTASTAAFLVVEPPFSGSCLVSLSGNGGGSGRDAALQAATGAIVVDEGSNGSVGAGRNASLIGGRAAANVAAVHIDLPSGQGVEASVGNGHWLAWWPGELTVVRIVARDADGTILATLDDATPGWKLK
jgi:hypothetical protein